MSFYNLNTYFVHIVHTQLNYYIWYYFSQPQIALNLPMLQDTNNFILCQILLLMSSLYFATSKGGYVQRTIQGTPSRITGRELPVHFRVNEFMHNPPKQPEQEILEVEEEAEHVQAYKSTKSLQITLEKGARSTLIKSAHQLQKPEGSEMAEDNMESSLIKHREYSSKDTSASQIDLNRKKLSVNLVESQVGKNEDFEDMFDRNQLERQIQKEKTLRKNLENSYKNLLHKLKTETKIRPFDYAPEKTTDGKESSIFKLANTKSSNELNSQKKYQRLRKQSQQCSQHSQKSSETQFNQQLNRHYSEGLQNVYQQQLRRERLFQRILIEEINKANTKIDELQTTLFKRQMQIQKMNQQKSLPQPSPLLSNKQQAYSSKNNPNPKWLRHEFHYIFTIFIMFLIIVVISKQGQK